MDPTDSSNPNSHYEATLSLILESPQMHQPKTTTGCLLQVYTRGLQPKHMYLQAYECEQKQGTKTSSSLPYSPDIINTNKPIATKKGARKFTKNPLYPITHYTSLKKFSPSYRAFLFEITSIQVPQTLCQALENNNWEDVMREQMNALKRNKTYDVVDLTKRKKTIECKWVFVLNYKADGSLERYKVRLVAKGYTEIYSVDYQDTFSLVTE